MGSNSKEICDQIVESDCDVLLLGLRLRNTSGLEIARQLRRIKPSIPILTIGFSTDVVNVPEMKNAGINAFIPMHSSNDYIVKKVRQCFRRTG